MDNSVSSFDLTPQMQQLTSDSLGDSSDQSGPSASQELMKSFSDTFEEKINQVESLQQDAQMKMKKFAAGEIDDVHEVSTSMQKASMGLNLASAVRTKVLESFDELQQMG